MHELLVFGATALGGSASLWWARLRWLSHRRRLGTLRVNEKLAPWNPLPRAGGGTIAWNDLRNRRAVVLVLMSNRCPGVKAYDARLRRLVERYEPAGVQFIGVNSVASHHYPGEDLPGMEEALRDRHFRFPYCKDERQELAATLGAVCTPEVFLLDGTRRLRYRGRIDDRLVEAKAKKTFLADAIDDVLGKRRVRLAETAPLGCSIEYAHSPVTTPAIPETAPSVPT